MTRLNGTVRAGEGDSAGVGADAGRDAPALDLSGALARESSRVEEALERALASLEPLLPPALIPPVRHGVLSGGKRLRPVLCAAAYRAVAGSSPNAAYDLGAAVELIHAYSLMHDDLPAMDDAGLRRGEPTTHRLHGVPATAWAGAALIPLAGLQAWRAARELAGDEVAREVLGTLAEAAGAGGMVGGQALDLLGEDRTLSAEELEDLHRRKTGALLTAALRMGALAGGASPEALEALEAYGRSLGLAFQIADDVLDATATAEELGKVPSDEALSKSTYVALHGLDGARRRARDEGERAREALRRGGVYEPLLHALAGYVVERRR